MIKKKIIVFSHERSGTHFLINSIALNFGYASSQIDIDKAQGVNWADFATGKQWFERFRGIPVSNIFKSHHDARFFVPLMDLLTDEYQIFYIYRDGRDVMTSFWHYLNQLAPGWGPQTETVGQFLRARPFGGILQYQLQEVETMLDRWVVHADSWYNTRSKVHFVCYDDLHNKFEDAMKVISNVLDQPLINLHRPGLDSPSSLPWRGKTGNWEQFFTEEDILYFEQHAHNTMLRLQQD